MRHDDLADAIAKELEAALKAYDANPRAQSELLAVWRQHDPKISADQARASIRLVLQKEHGFDASDEAASAACHREAEAGHNLLNVRPTTLAGVVALLRHAVAFRLSGEIFPGGYEIEGEHEMIEEATFEFMLLDHVADV